MCGSGDDQRRPGLVDENRVDFVNDCEVPVLLDLFGHTELHVVTQVVEAELGRRAVEDVARIGVLLLLVRLHVMRVDRARAEAQRPEEREHPVPVTLHEVVVDGDDVNLLAVEYGQVGRQRSDDRLALAGLHLGDVPFVEHDRPDDLHVEWARPVRRLRVRVKIADRVVQLRRDVDKHPGRHGLLRAQEIALRLCGIRRVDLGLHLVVQGAHVVRQRRRVEIEIGVEEVADPDVPVHHLASDGEHLRQHVDGLGSPGHLLAERAGALAELLIGELLDLVFICIDQFDHAQVAFHHALVARSEHLAHRRADDGDTHVVTSIK